MSEIWNVFVNLFAKNGLVAAFLIVGIMTVVSNLISKFTHGRIHSSAIAIFLGLILAYIGGVVVPDGQKGLADIAMFGGIGLLGSSMMRDFTIVSTAFGAKFSEIKKCGLIGILSLVIGVVLSFVVGAVIAVLFGFDNAKDVATIGAGACTFVVGPVTAEAVGASAEAATISIAVGVIKSVAVMLVTPMVAKKIGLTTPRAAMIFGGLMGTTSGSSAGLAATDPKLVPYGAMTATFYTGLGCLLCPTVLYFITQLFF